MLRLRFLLLPLVILLPAAQAVPWGWNTHRFINRTGVRHLPPVMASFSADSASFAAHAHDADARRVSGDTSFYAEGPRHYLDIDDYPGFRTLPRSLDTLILLYGWERVKRNGISPWAMTWMYDSLVAQLRRGDAPRVLQSASDLGHYIGDICQPLHNTRNYNGQYTGNNGIHSRYETTMLSPSYYLSALTIQPLPAAYVPDRLAAAFDEVLRSQELVAAVLRADTYARQASGWNGSGTAPAAYYHALWDSSEGFTRERVQRASAMLGALWYSAWVDAGLITLTAEGDGPTMPGAWSVEGSFPNPFNPSAMIRFRLPEAAGVTITLYDVLGREVAQAFSGDLQAGGHTVPVDGHSLAGGVYFCRIRAISLTGQRGMDAVHRMMLVR